MSRNSDDWQILPSRTSTGTVNPIREIVDKLDLRNLPKDKPLIPLSIGDPTKFGNLPVPKEAVRAVKEALESWDNNGYQPSFGNTKARAAIARSYKGGYRTEDVFIASGCSDAINLTMCALLDEGDNVLLPSPGFSLYTTICGRYGFEAVTYDLLPERQWEVDLDDMRSKINERTKAILVNNPSNPCGSVYSREHLEDICKVAYEHHLPIIADEIYADMVFEGETFVSCNAVTRGPVFLLGGLAKQYLAPGWRVGWIVMHDPEHRMEQVRPGLVSLTQVILGANSIVQAALPTILDSIPRTYYEGLNTTLTTAARIMYEGFARIPGLKPVKPQGAMYLMVEILVDEFENMEDDVVFCQKLLREQAVMCLPGTIFGAKNFFRVVLCPPPEQLRKSMQRIEQFCANEIINTDSPHSPV